MTGLKKILAEVGEKLSVELNCYAEGERKKGVPYCDKPFESVTDDGENTFFRFTYKGVGYVGVLSGVDERQKNCAFLLPAYLESSLASENERTKEEFLRDLMFGEYTQSSAARYVAKYALGNSPCFVVIVQTEKLLTEAISLATQYTGNSLDAAVRLNENSFAMVKFVQKDEDKDASCDYAEFLAQTLKEELGLSAVIGVGETVQSVREIGQSFEQATAALRYAEMFESTDSVHTYRQYLLVKLLEEIPQSRLGEYAALLSDERAKAVFEDEEMMATVEEFLRSSLNVSETARNLYVHRNTLIYRLDKIKETTGLNVRNFTDAVSFRVLTLINQLKEK
ncbi:MAG: helix-turn-helix domain-containing protein [Clostridia bacterium]|nr:helix-turn-helix domain-containing protein [Clostridia bacterium]